MSTSPTRSGRRSGRHFIRLLLGTVLVLAVLVGGLTLLNTTRGPKLESAAINLQSVIAHPGQRLLLHGNQPLADIQPDQVTVTPEVPVSVGVDGTTITVTFGEILNYNTRYTVRIDPVVGLFHEASSAIEYDFTTDDAELFTLHRDSRLTGDGTKRPDEIRRDTLSGGGGSQVMFAADRIQEFVTLPGNLAVVTLQSDDSNHLTIVSLTNGSRLDVTLPPGATLKNLRASGSTNLLAFTLTETDSSPAGTPRDILHTFDSGNGSVPEPVLGVDQQPLAVTDFTFVPDTTSLVAHKPDEVMYLIGAGDGSITPLGQHVEMRGFIPGTNLLVVADPTQGSTIDLSTGTVAALDLPADELGDAVPGKLEVIDAEGNYVRLYHVPGSDGAARPLLARTDHTHSALVYEPASEKSKVRNFCVSPNGKYAAVETVSPEGVGDRYPTVPGSSAMQTTFVDLSTKKAVRSVPGFLPHWCR